MSQQEFVVKDRSNEYVWSAGIRFLETLAELWPIKLRMLKADQAGDWALVDEIKLEMKPIVKRAERPLNEALFWRIKAQEVYEENEEVRVKENEMCSKDFARFIINWCYTSDPRLPPLGLPNMIPFIIWPKQEEFLMWVDDAYTTGRSWLAEKSRGWGLTWLLAAYYVWHWLFHTGFIGGFGSRDKEAVDKLGDPDTIFAKVRFLIYNLPDPMLPESYRGKTIMNPCAAFDNYLRIVNPEKESTIRGEGGDNIGAGGRASIYCIDESALVQHPEKIDDALSYTTNCRGDVSTVRGMNHFGEKRHSGRVRVFTSWYYQDPSKYKYWRDDRRPTPEECPFLEHELLDKGELVVNQELLIDYSRSVEDSFIPADWVQAAVDFDIPAEGDKQAGFDIAGGGANHSVYSSRTGPVLNYLVEIPVDTPQEALECALGYGEDDKVDDFVYDQDGIGESVYGHVKFTERKLKFKLLGIHGNSNASEKFIFPDGVRAREKFRNKRAENWWNLRERFRKTYEHRKGTRIYDYQELISIPNNHKLTTQLSQPRRVYGKKIGVESKENMRTRGVKSPDEADSVVNAYADLDKEMVVISDFNYQDQGNISEFDIDHESAVGQQYVSLVTTDDMMTYALSCWWIPVHNNPLLRVYWEYMRPSNEVKSLVSDIKDVMCESIKPIREWICNPEMLKSLETGKQSLWHLYRNEKVSLRKNYIDDYQTSITLTNIMFSKGLIEIHSRCDKLPIQVSNWRIEKGKPQRNLGFAIALCQLVTRLRTKKEIKKDIILPQWAPKKPYNDAQGHFSRTAKNDDLNVSVPEYLKLAEKQVKNYAKKTEIAQQA